MMANYESSGPIEVEEEEVDQPVSRLGHTTTA